jgi:predicted ATPase
MVRGGALAEQGQVEEGIAQMQQSLAAFRAMGAEGGSAWISLLPWLATAYAKAERREEGLSVVAEALAFVDKTGGRFSEAELYRLKGTLVLQSGVRGPESENPNTQYPTPSTQEEAEACFHKAIEIARRQQAKSLELRAAMSLSRLWQQQGKKDEARQLLAEIYGWFTEGFDTKDLQEARALLDELAEGV